MANYDNNNSGMMARNDRRTTDKHPEFTGTITVDGRDYWISAWVNEGREGSKMEGKKYFSIKVNPKDLPASATRQAPSRPAPDFSDMDSDIPF